MGHLAARASALGLLLLSTSACAQPEVGSQVAALDTDGGPVVVERVAVGLSHPWALALLPDGRMLVTERAGRLRIVDQDGTLSDPLEGVPEVLAQGQGGLLDVAIDPDFAENQFVYLSYAKRGPGSGNATALGRGRLEDGRLVDFQDIFVQTPWVASRYHFGSRIVFADDGTLFFTLGERFQFMPAQDLSGTLGKVVRLNRDGTIPADNPFVDRDGADPAIWSVGHRNIQAADIDPATGDLWVVEFGPMGGDELNRPEAGHNYGWPHVSWGKHYDGRDLPDPPTRPEFDDAVKYWNPVISPSGMEFYAGDTVEAWAGSAFVGALSGHALVRLKIEGHEVVQEEQLPLPARIRDVQQGPDGFLYLVTDEDDGQVWRVRPQ